EWAEVLLNRDDIDAKADAFIDFLADRVLNKDFDDGFGRQHRVQNFADLDALFRAIFDGLEATGRSDMWRTHHIATIRKVRNRLANISTRCKGLVTDDGLSNDLPWGEFQDRTVYVVDLANVDPLGQDLVFARVVSKLREHLERRDLGVDAVVVFVDELNKYAPAACPAARPGRRGALPAGGRPAVRGGGRAPVAAARSAHPAEPGEGRDRRSQGGGCPGCAGCGATRAAGGRAGLFPESARHPRRA